MNQTVILEAIIYCICGFSLFSVTSLFCEILTRVVTAGQILADQIGLMQGICV